jgi:hypothetical protein
MTPISRSKISLKTLSKFRGPFLIIPSCSVELKESARTKLFGTVIFIHITIFFI